jgi:esterase FrsA
VPEQNLSERLFKPTFKYPETSTLIRRVSDYVYNPNVSEPSVHWYRLLTKATWLWQGVSHLDIGEALARIATSKNPRTDDRLLDTVIGYNSGNWIYEWSKQAMNWQQKALASEQSDALLAGQYWLKAANLYSIASYPHLQGDTLAEQAEVLANKAYDEAFTRLPYARKAIEFEVKGGKLTAMLHLPDITKGPYPTVMLCGSLGTLQGDYFQLFNQFLAPAGIAMLCVDMPSVGYSAKWKLSYDCSKLHQQVLRQLSTVPWIDHNNVFALGFFFGANVAVRLAYLEPKRLRGVVSWDGLVHSLMVDHKLHQNIPDMYKDVLASRLGLSSVSDSLLEAEMTRYSLKVQGLLGHRCPTPMLAMSMNNNLYSTESDAKLIASSSLNGKLISMPKTLHQDHITASLMQMMEWIEKKMR